MTVNRPCITLTCDFGDTFAVGQVEIVIANINPDARFILASNTVAPYSIVEGAFILEKFTQFALRETIHIGVIDPGVGSERRGVIIRTNNFYFIGPNNGLFYPAAAKDSIKNAYHINEEKLGSLSNTFHGRDIFAKVAAYLSLKQNPSEFSTPIDINTLRKIEYKQDQIVHIDPYGNIKLNNSGEYTKGDILTLQYKDRTFEIPFVTTFADVAKGAWLAYQGSHQTLELAVNQDNACTLLNAKIEDTIEIKGVQKATI